AAPDAGAPVDASDGAVSTCGNGILEGAERCDDGNSAPFDGCEADCTFTCETADDCDNHDACDGAETCGASHVCADGTALSDGTACTTTAHPDGVCRSRDCVGRMCGNGVPEAGEDCDDGNTDDADGCRTNCTFTCRAAGDCSNHDRCDGEETCDASTH